MSDSSRPNDDGDQQNVQTTETDLLGGETVCVDPMLLANCCAHQVRVTEKPPPGPMKRKKKLDRSLVDLSCSPRDMEEKRQKIADDKSSAATKPQPSPPPPPSAHVTSSPKMTTTATRGKAKELQNHTMFKLKRKNEETSAALVQKLNAYTEQLRLEVNNLKTALISEKNAVRALR